MTAPLGPRTPRTHIPIGIGPKKQELEIGCRQALYGMNAVSERLGHSTINIALDTYSHVMPDMQDEAAEKLHGVLKAVMGGASRRRR